MRRTEKQTCRIRGRLISAAQWDLGPVTGGGAEVERTDVPLPPGQRFLPSNLPPRWSTPQERGLVICSLVTKGRSPGVAMEGTEGPELGTNEMSEEQDRTGISERKGREKAKLTAKPSS